MSGPCITQALGQPSGQGGSVAAKNRALNEILALIDAVRDGQVRERQFAEKALSARLRKLLRG